MTKPFRHGVLGRERSRRSRKCSMQSGGFRSGEDDLYSTRNVQILPTSAVCEHLVRATCTGYTSKPRRPQYERREADATSPSPKFLRVSVILAAPGSPGALVDSAGPIGRAQAGIDFYPRMHAWGTEGHTSKYTPLDRNCLGKIPCLRPLQCGFRDGFRYA